MLKVSMDGLLRENIVDHSFSAGVILPSRGRHWFSQEGNCERTNSFNAQL